MTAAPRAPRFDVDALLRSPDTRIIVCCGSGGVGKTTTAAALGLRAAELGRRVVVLTIDPARRLAQSMGLTHLDNVPRAVPGITGPGSLDAMMLDMKRTFDELVESHTDPERAQQVLANPFYQALSSSFAGTQEYMAMEKLGQLRHKSDAEDLWDLIVVDTPPSRSALDFLDAPNRLGSFLDGRFIRLLSGPAKGAGKGIGRVVGVGLSLAAGVMNKVLGTQLLTDVSTFVQALDTIFGGFRQRAEETYRILQEPGTSFVVVAAPEPDAVREATYFVDRLTTEDMPLAGLVLNRVTLAPVHTMSAEQAVVAADALGQRGEHPATAALLRMHADTMRAAARQRHVAERFTAAHPGVRQSIVPALADDVHDLAGLREVGERLGQGLAV
jgi:anion-transporting  ArsA/GET3 family ATPase